MKYLVGTSLAVLLSACATVEPLCDPEQRRAVTNAAGDVLYYLNQSCPPVRDGRDGVFASMAPAPDAPVPTLSEPVVPSPEPAPEPEPTPAPTAPEPSTPTQPNTPDRPKGDASLNSGQDRTGRGDNGKGQGKNRS